VTWSWWFLWCNGHWIGVGPSLYVVEPSNTVYVLCVVPLVPFNAICMLPSLFWLSETRWKRTEAMPTTATGYRYWDITGEKTDLPSYHVMGGQNVFSANHGWVECESEPISHFTCILNSHLTHWNLHHTHRGVFPFILLLWLGCVRGLRRRLKEGSVQRTRGEWLGSWVGQFLPTPERYPPRSSVKGSYTQVHVGPTTWLALSQYSLTARFNFFVYLKENLTFPREPLRLFFSGFYAAALTPTLNLKWLACWDREFNPVFGASSRR
jgi:hypothetical protein